METFGRRKVRGRETRRRHSQTEVYALGANQFGGVDVITVIRGT